MPKAIELKKGQKFSRLTCTGEYEKIKSRRWYEFECDCGNKKMAQAKEVICGKINSCGCFKADKIRERCYIGRDKARDNGVYTSWAGMISRCGNADDPKYKRYGGRGIKVCDRWKSFDLFHEDMGDRPSKNHSLGRIDNDRDYEPDNCRWETHHQQANNTSRNRFIEVHGERMTVAQASRKYGANVDSIYVRLDKGMSPEDAVKNKNYIHVFVIINDERINIGEALKKLSIPHSTYYKRLRQGYSPQEVIDHYCGVKRMGSISWGFNQS